MENSAAVLDAHLRDRIISDPAALLDDSEVMAALVGANERAMGSNIVDLRGIAMERLEARLDRLEDTHRSVIAAAYENLAGTNQIHRAVLHLLDAADLEAFLGALEGDVARVLRLEEVRLVLEGAAADEAAVQDVGPVLSLRPAGFVESYLGRGRSAPLRQVTLRPVGEASPLYAGGAAIRSEACLALDLGEAAAPGLLAMGSADPHLFTPQQGTDLLGFFAGVVERAMRRWL